jgi:hypothetical protein
MATKNSKIGSDLNRIPTVEDRFVFVEPAITVELAGSVRLFDTRQVEVEMVAKTSRQGVYRINGNEEDGFDYKAEEKSFVEPGDPIRKDTGEAKAIELTVTKNEDEIKKAKKEIEKLEKLIAQIEMYNAHIKDNGLQYNEKGSSISIDVVVM